MNRRYCDKVCIMRFGFALTFLAIMLFASASSQAQENASIKITQPTRVDVFGDVGEREFGQRLKRFMEVLQSDPTLRGYVVYHASFNSSPFRQTPFYQRRMINQYFMYLRQGCFDGPRITIITANMRESKTIELWVAHGDDHIPFMEDGIAPLSGTKQKLELLTTVRFDPGDAASNDQVIDDADNDDEAEAQEDTSSDPVMAEEDEDYIFELADVLASNKAWRSVVFFYVDDKKVDLRQAKEYIERQMRDPHRETKIDMSRVKINYGGFRASPEIEIWIVPENGIEPEAMPDERIDQP